MSEVITAQDEREVCFIVSDALHYLRSTLDHLVYHASWFDQGSPQDGTQFPICDSEERWNRSSARRQLGGMSAEHASWIWVVQPYNGEQWSKDLHTLSNADKHRMGDEVSPTCIFRPDMANGMTDPSDDRFALVPLESVALHLGLPAFGQPNDTSTIFTEMFVGVGKLLICFWRTKASLRFR